MAQFPGSRSPEIMASLVGLVIFTAGNSSTLSVETVTWAVFAVTP